MAEAPRCRLCSLLRSLLGSVLALLLSSLSSPVKFIMPIRPYLLAFMVAALSACATTPPFPEETLHTINRELTPEQAVKEQPRDVQVLWGGLIIKAANTADHTDLTVLFYPLDNSQRPDLDRKPLSRFIVRYPGYLEIVVYAPGREVTVLGSLQGVEEGKVGDALYSFPVVKTDKVHLWPAGDDSKVHFGVSFCHNFHLNGHGSARVTDANRPSFACSGRAYSVNQSSLNHGRSTCADRS